MNSEPVPVPPRKFQLRRWQTYALEVGSFALDELIKKAKAGDLDMDDELSEHDGRWTQAGKQSKLFGLQADRYKFLNANKSLSLLTDKVRNNQLTSKRYLHLRGQVFDAGSDLQAKAIVDDFISNLGGSANKTMIGTPETPATMGGDLRPFRTMQGDPSNPATMDGDLRPFGTMQGDPENPATMDGDLRPFGTMQGDPENPATMDGAPSSAMVRKAIVLVPGDVVHDSQSPRYEVIKKLGEGSQGAVYKVKDLRFEGMVKAIKIQDPMQSCKEALKARFMREGLAGNIIQHPHVVRVDDAKDDEVRKLVYLVMDFVDGSSLRDFINANPKGMEVQVVLSLIQSILDGLKAMHKYGIIHKDIKPENILIEKRGNLLFPKIADLGLAGIDDVTGAVGTFDYMAPEQKDGSAGITAIADLYALGKIFHELLTGHRPEISLEPLGILRPEAAQFESVCRMSIKKNIEERYQHCDEFLGALNLANDGKMRLDTALGLKRSGDKKAFSELKALAGYGETNAMHELADCFFKGFGCPPSDESGMKWLEEGARNGHALAMKELARRYNVGDGCQIDPEMAAIWERKRKKLGIGAVEAVSAKDTNLAVHKSTSRRKIYDPFSDSEVELTVSLPEFDRLLLLRTERNDPNAMVDLAHQIYRWANEINRAAEQKQGLIYAGHWFHRAAKFANGEAMRMLGKMCLSFSDDGVNDGNESFEDMAETWFQDAAEAGDPEGMFEYSQMCMDDELKESECEEWMDKAASQNFVGALNWKGERQLSGTKPYIKNKLEACECFKRSAKHDSPEGMLQFGLCLRHGWGTVAKPQEAFEWFAKAQKLGNKQACAELANCYTDGVGVESNPIRAFELFKESALDADVYSMAKVGQFLQEGRGVEKSEAEAMPWLRRAAEAGHAEAMFLLAGCYERQREPDSRTELSADEWFIKAADAGYTQSYFKAGEISFNELDYMARKYFKDFINCHPNDTLCPQAQYYLGYCFEMGLDGGDVDIKIAIELYNKSTKHQNCFAAERLAYAYLFGNSVVVKNLENAERWAGHAGKWKLPADKHEALTVAIRENGRILHPNLPGLEKKNKARMGGGGVIGFLFIIAIFLGTAWTLNHYKYFGYAYTSCAVAAIFLLLAIIDLILEWVQEDTYAFLVFGFLSIIIAANEYATPRFMPLWVGWTIYLSAQLFGTILFITAFDKKKPSYSGAIFGGMILISTSIVVYRFLH